MFLKDRKTQCKQPKVIFLSQKIIREEIISELGNNILKWIDEGFSIHKMNNEIKRNYELELVKIEKTPKFIKIFLD